MNDDTRSLAEQVGDGFEPEFHGKDKAWAEKCEAAFKPKFKPDNTPRQGKVMPKYRKPTRGTKGAFGKARNKPKAYDLTNFLSEQARKLEAQLLLTGQISEPTRKAIDQVFGEGTTVVVAAALIQKATQGAA